MPPNIESDLTVTAVDPSRFSILPKNSTVTEKQSDSVDSLNAITQENWYKVSKSKV